MASAAFTRQAGNLPADVTSFVDRRQEMAEVKQLLSVARLVTLTGVGGVGKTRLALRSAAEQRRAFDETWLADLSGLHDPGLVVPTVAAAVGLRDQSSRHLLEALGEFLAGRHALLVLDNCEHLIDACAVLADVLLRTAPRLHILATSRQSLGVEGERTLAVLPLPVPDDGPFTLDGLEGCASVGLFTDRAAAVLPGFTLDTRNHEAVARLCRRLDGIPLAIELAAVRLRALSVADIVTRLDDRRRLLAGAHRAAPPRQQSLHDLIDWSFQLLTPPEQTVWTRAAVFSGHFDLSAAEAVCADDRIPLGDIAGLLDALVDKSLLLREEHHGRIRFRMLETLRQFGLEQLSDARGLLTLETRHRDWYRRLIDQASHEWFGPRQVDWFIRLRLEQPNIRAALAFCVREPGQAGIGLEMATRLHRPHWLANSYFTEGRHWLDRLLGADDSTDEVALARGHYTYAWLTLIQGDDAVAQDQLERSRVLAERTGDPDSLAHVCHVAGLAAVFRDDMAEAARHLEQALTRHAAKNDLFGVVMTSLPLALALYRRGQRDRSAELLERCLTLTESHEESWCRAWTLTVLAIQMWRRGRHRRATSLARESLLLNRALDDRHNMTLDIEVLAWIAADSGDHEYAAGLIGAAENIAATVGIAVLHFAIHMKYHSTTVELLRRAMGDRLYAEAVARGRRLTLEQTVAQALGEQITPEAGPSGDDGIRSPLTRRETEIAALIAEGLSNKEIAAKLVISQRTAEGHVENILGKLGFNSRTQVAAWVTRQPAS